MSIPIAVQLYSVRDIAELDFEGVIKKIKAMGYDGVEFAGLYGHSPEEVRDICKANGIIPISAHVPYEELVCNLEKTLRDYAAIGCKYIAIPWMDDEDRPGGKRYTETVENIKKIGCAARKFGLKLLYHNHDFEFAVIDGRYGLDILYDDIPSEILETEIDTCWVNVGGEDPAAYIRKYSGRAPIVHLKDFVGEKSENMYELIGKDRKAPERPSNFSFMPVGFGVQDFPEILKATREADAEWIVVEIDSPPVDMESSVAVKKSIDYLKTLEF